MLGRCPERAAPLLAASWLLLAALGCTGSTAAPPPPAPERRPAARAAAWPQADALFRRDPRWLGGDAAVSVELGRERVLWLFGDSFIAPQGATARSAAHFVHNSIALQHGSDPSRAELRFFWRSGETGLPASFFPERDERWRWPGDGLYHDGVLTLFLIEVRAEPPAAGSLGFRVIGWTAVRVPNADAEPLAWQLEPLATPDTGTLGVVGAAVLREGEHVYAYAVREPGDHAIMLLRWSFAEFARGELMHPSYFGGEAHGFGPGPAGVLMKEGATEFSVSRAPHGGYVQVQARGFGAAGIAWRFAARVNGPFTAPEELYRPEEAGRPGMLVYAARAHPELAGADMVLTYALNTLDPAALMADLDTYFPRFVRVEMR